MIFKYIYYSLHKGYKEMGENLVPGSYAVGIVTVLQWLPVFCILHILDKLKFIVFQPDKKLVVITVLGLLAVNSAFYLSKQRHQKIVEDIEKLDNKRRNFIRAFAIIYSLLAILISAILLTL